MDEATKIALLRAELQSIMIAAQRDDKATADAKFLALFNAASADESYFDGLAGAKKAELQNAAEDLATRRSELLAQHADLDAKSRKA